VPSGTPLKGDRIHWLRIRFQGSAGAEILQLGELEGCDQTTLNGQLIGTGSGRWTRQYVIPKGLLRSGTNEVIIRLAPAYGGIGLHGKPDTVGLVTAGRFSTLASQVEARDGVLLNAAPPPKDIEANPTVPTLLYNGMIAPIAPLSVRGAIWYQGETNMGRGIQYRKLLPAFLASWRKAFRSPKLPIHVVSLANWTARLAEPAEAPMAELREAQFLSLQRDATSGLAMAYDLGDADDIHPKDKASVGLRLALCALAKNYGKSVEFSGPTLARWTVQGDEVRLTLHHAMGLKLVNGGASFSVAGKDRKFVWAKARLEGSTVILTAPKGIQPVAARYAWANNPEVGLVNGAGLPAVPFRTDDWPVTSSPRKEN
jgi:sialate O-acetylesterase